MIDQAATSANDRMTRMQAPRTLWDPDYKENSWIGMYNAAELPLIPHMQKSIDNAYPGTKLAFTEYSLVVEMILRGESLKLIHWAFLENMMSMRPIAGS
ncbi:hypothetical protein P4S72_24890 [Vibrio sp. PP-XX7]